MPRPLADPRMLTAMGGFFAQTVTIQSAVTTQDALGAASLTWSDLAGHIALPCNFYQPTGKAGGGEKRTKDGTFLIGFSLIVIKGAYADITEQMRAVVDGLTLDIKIAGTDSQGIATTLTCELVR